MVNINEQFPSKYIKSSDLGGNMVKVQIRSLQSEEIGSSQKMIMYFTGKEKGLVLNKTNAQTLAEQFGDETDNWVGANIEIFSMKVQYEGRMVDGIRVRIPPQPRQTQQRTNGNGPVTTPARFIPNARDDARMQQAPPPADEELNDEIPF